MSAGAGYSGKPVWQKLGLQPGQRLRVIDTPGDYAALVEIDPAAVAPNEHDDELELVHLFVRRQAELLPALRQWLPRIVAGGMCWVSWPKKSSPLHGDLTEDGVRAAALPLGWVDVKVCAIDADWSGLKLLRRREG